MITRRSLVRGSALTLAGTLVARPLAGMRLERFQGLPAADDPQLKQLIHTAIDAATAAGASYVDARLTITQEMAARANVLGPGRKESMCIGVRAVSQGYWGFAASTVWSSAEAVRLGRNAVANAKANVLGKVRDLQMAPLVSPSSGDWVMPVKDDPFEMAFEELWDHLRGLQNYMEKLPQVNARRVSFLGLRQRRVFGSSLGQFITQRVYGCGGEVILGVESTRDRRRAIGNIEEISYAGLGFEYFRDQPLRQLIDKKHEELLQELELPIIPVDVGKYPVLIDATGAAAIVSESIGAATEVDRVMGYEANAGGTSYIVDPDEMLGTFKIGASVLNVSGSRSMPGGCTTVRWDDDGVEPREFPIVRDGLLVNLQTHREGCGWISSHYKKTGQPMVSVGCASSTDAMASVMANTADLTVQPDPTSEKTKDTLRAAMDRGLEWKQPSVTFDFQKSTGLLRGSAFDIKGGKRVAVIPDAGMIFRSSEFWNNLQQLGGRESVRRIGVMKMKGEPRQFFWHSVDTPPMLSRDMTVIDVKRKA